MPAEHCVQLVAPPSEKLPGKQPRHAPPPPALKKPAAQDKQESREVPLPGPLVDVPAGQLVQLDAETFASG